MRFLSRNQSWLKINWFWTRLKLRSIDQEVAIKSSSSEYNPPRDALNRAWLVPQDCLLSSYGN